MEFCPAIKDVNKDQFRKDADLKKYWMQDQHVRTSMLICMMIIQKNIDGCILMLLMPGCFYKTTATAATITLLGFIAGSDFQVNRHNPTRAVCNKCK